ncbi:hypothetical protein BDA96_04G223000 [Sorghum bicolor]|uniref:Cyclin-like domain-containing protein n=1 Tax=Sorghum bicolor TaxID=4558 RepID=A0A921ULC4_SORBI|nr:hypothetical protein BDA96_04G223000 [Sorghum bicolor]
MDAFIKRPLVRQIPPPGFESCSSVPSAGFNPSPVYDYGNPFDADGRASLAMEVPAPWDPCYDNDDGHVVQPGVEEPAVSVSSAAPVCDGGTLNDDDNSTREDEAEAKPSPDYLETTQRGRMSQDTRPTLVGWMRRFAQCYGLAPGALHRAVSYADRFLSVRPLADDVGMPRLRLLGAVAVYAAAKYEDQGTVEVLDAADIASYGRRCGGGGGFASSKEEVLWTWSARCSRRSTTGWAAPRRTRSWSTSPVTMAKRRRAWSSAPARMTSRTCRCSTTAASSTSRRLWLRRPCCWRG